MILYKGKTYESHKQGELIASLPDDFLNTLQKGAKIHYIDVINACDALYRKVMNHEFDDIALPLLRAMNMPFSMLERYASCFSKEGLLKKIDNELGELKDGPLPLDENNVRQLEPLGVLFHIAAGNVDLLPAYSVIEGLLVGNINILKLPSGDNGLSIRLLKEIIDLEPRLAEYIYVFDVPSTEVETIKALSAMSDATIVWGGEEVCKAARSFVDIHSSLILWGHKISFSYLDQNVRDEELEALAESICLSNQLFCSSAQGIYINSENRADLQAFAVRFLPILAKTSKKFGTLPLTMKAKNSLLMYNEALEGRGDDIFQQDGVSIEVKEGNKLELSHLYQNVWVKALPKKEIVKALKGNKNLLQTVSINEAMEDKEEIVSSLIASGVTRVVPLGENSRMLPGESHDGEYALRRYSRIVEKPRR